MAIYIVAPMNRRQEVMPFCRKRLEGTLPEAMKLVRSLGWRHWSVATVLADGTELRVAVSPRDKRLKAVESLETA
jgi:hypothetical protein